MTKVLSTNLSHREGGGAGAKGFYLKLFHEQVGYERTNGGSHSCTLDLFIILPLEEEVSVGEAKLQYGCDLLYGHAGPFVLVLYPVVIFVSLFVWMVPLVLK